MFPVFIKKPGETPPDTIPHYIVAKNGVFLKKSNWWVDAIVPVKQIAVLEDEESKISLKIPPISAIVLMKAWLFFQKVYKEHISESAVMLHYSAEYGWELTIPEQTVSFAHVNYKMDDRIEGYSFIGTMHSHSSMSASHSHTDVGDQNQMDGVHITFGLVNSRFHFDMDAEVFVNGARFKLPLCLMEGLVEIPSSAKFGSVLYLRPKKKFFIECPDLFDWIVPEEWMEKVSHLLPEPKPLFQKFSTGGLLDQQFNLEECILVGDGGDFPTDGRLVL